MVTKSSTKSKFPEHYFDFISIDGRARVSCIFQALSLLKQEGGILVVDNTIREQYLSGLKIIPNHWKKFEDNNGVFQTTIYLSL